jgi:hypothetical protein
MFKASGELLEKKLQTFARGLGCNWLSVVTGPKGSYREEHVLQYLERHLPQMTEGRRWRLLLLDAYAPQMSDSVRRLCWQRGYIVIIHGGGATGVTQVNDTDLHQHLRKTYVEHEMAAMIKAARLNPNSTPVPKCEQCVTWMANIWSNPQLHLNAAKVFKRTGITNALDGSEDLLIVREAGHFWNSLSMPAQRNAAVHDVSVEVAANRIKWAFADVYKLVSDFPRTGHLDQLVEFQDDELVIEDGACEPVWDEDAEVEQGDDCSAAADFHGDAKSADFHGDGKSTSSMCPQPPSESLSAIQADEVIKHGSRRDALKKALEIVSQLDCPSLEITISRIMHKDEQLLRSRLHTDPAVALSFQRNRLAQEQAFAQEQLQIKDALAAKQATKAALKEAKEQQQQLQRIKAQLRDAQDLIAAKDALKSYTPDMLGEGRPRGGGAAYRIRRHEVLDRLLTHANLTPQQRNDWAWFKDEWDKKMSEIYNQTWGSEFAQICQGLLNKVQAGDSTVFSEFMYSETRRHLSEVPLLRL